MSATGFSDANTVVPGSIHHHSTSTSTSPTLHDQATESHALAVAAVDHDDEKGVAQEAHDEPEVRDLGWRDDAKQLSSPLVAGLSNEELWLLIRRFDKVGTTCS